MFRKLKAFVYRNIADAFMDALSGFPKKGKKKKDIKPGSVIVEKKKNRFPDCPACNKNNWLRMPDSLAIACECGYVLVESLDGKRYTPGATLQEWAKDLYEARQRREKS